jgi:hypothetical protein
LTGILCYIIKKFILKEFEKNYVHTNEYFQTTLSKYSTFIKEQQLIDIIKPHFKIDERALEFALNKYGLNIDQIISTGGIYKIPKIFDFYHGVGAHYRRTIHKLDDYGTNIEDKIIIIDNLTQNIYRYADFIRKNKYKSYICIQYPNKEHADLAHYINNIAGYYFKSFKVYTIKDFSDKIEKRFESENMPGARLIKNDKYEFIKTDHQYTPENTIIYLDKVMGKPNLHHYELIANFTKKSLLYVTNSCYKKNFSNFKIVNDNLFDYLKDNEEDLLKQLCIQGTLSDSTYDTYKSIFNKLDSEKTLRYIKDNKDELARFMASEYFSNTNNLLDIFSLIHSKKLNMKSSKLFKNVTISQQDLISNIKSFF